MGIAYYVAGIRGLINGQEAEIGDRLTSDIGSLENLRRLVDLGIVVPQHDDRVSARSRGRRGVSAAAVAVADDDEEEGDDMGDPGPILPGSGPHQQATHDAEIAGHSTESTRALGEGEPETVAPEVEGGVGVMDEGAHGRAAGDGPSTEAEALAQGAAEARALQAGEEPDESGHVHTGETVHAGGEHSEVLSTTHDLPDVRAGRSEADAERLARSDEAYAREARADNAKAEKAATRQAKADKGGKAQSKADKG
jgi:hypothetical protein